MGEEKPQGEEESESEGCSLFYLIAIGVAVALVVTISVVCYIKWYDWFAKKKPVQRAIKRAAPFPRAKIPQMKPAPVLPRRNKKFAWKSDLPPIAAGTVLGGGGMLYGLGAFDGTEERRTPEDTSNTGSGWVDSVKSYLPE